MPVLMIRVRVVGSDALRVSRLRCKNCLNSLFASLPHLPIHVGPFRWAGPGRLVGRITYTGMLVICRDFRVGSTRIKCQQQSQPARFRDCPGNENRSSLFSFFFFSRSHPYRMMMFSPLYRFHFVVVLEQVPLRLVKRHILNVVNSFGMEPDEMSISRRRRGREKRAQMCAGAMKQDDDSRCLILWFPISFLPSFHLLGFEFESGRKPVCYCCYREPSRCRLRRRCLQREAEIIGKGIK